MKTIYLNEVRKTCGYATYDKRNDTGWLERDGRMSEERCGDHRGDPHTKILRSKEIKKS